MPARSTITIARSSWIRTITTSSTIAAAPMPMLGDLDKALADFDKAIALKPDYALGHANRGWVLAQRNKHDEAVVEYSEAIRLAPGNPDNLNDRGWSLIKIEQYDRAIADFDEAIRIKPEHINAWQNCGWAYWLKGDLDKALADLDQAVSLDPGQSRPAARPCRGARRQGRFRPSRSPPMTRFSAIAPDEGRALNGRAWGYAQKGELDKALDDAERAVRLLKDEPNALHTRAWIYMNKGQLDTALADFDRALSLDPELAGAYADRGRA